MGIFSTGQGAANRLNQQNMDFIKSIFGNISDQQATSLFGMLNEQFRKGEGFMTQAVGEVAGGFDKALATTSNYGRGAERGILRREKQRLGNARGRLASSGLYSSTGAINLERGIGADTDAALLNVSDSQAQMMGGLQRDRGMAIGGALGDLSRFLASKAQIGAGIGGQLGSLMSRFQFQAGSSLFSQFSGLLGVGLGKAMTPAPEKAWHSIYDVQG